jgi:pepF/M3 family oligoendopeptidase
MLSGALAWTRLQGVVNSQLKAPIEIDGKIEETPLSILATYLREPDGDLRERSYYAIKQAFSEVGEPLAACLNGIKGSINVINAGRGREDAVHSSLEQSRIDREILQTMLEAMSEAFPMLRRYLLAKARLLGKERLSPWDVGAPVGSTDRIYEWAEAQEFILGHFDTYSPEMKVLAERAFVAEWIDAEPRDGKSGGGFCLRAPSVQESRILINFDGRMNELATLAHELGHAYHILCLRGKSSLQAAVPMTLAETASIFCETIITEAILAQAGEIDEELAVLDAFLKTASVLTLDIYARYLFEKEIFTRREEAELSAKEFNELTTRYYRETYGDSMMEGELWPYLWAYLPHYYISDLSFYNYPYTFGFLFSLGLYQIYEKREPGFHEKYDRLLADSASENAAELAERFGIDLYQPAFWAGGYEIVRKRVERFEELVTLRVQR